MHNSQNHETSKWNKIFRNDGKAVIVALDHIASGLMKGWEYPHQTIAEILQGDPDAILTNFGILKRFSSLIPDSTGRILRIDGGPSDISSIWPNCNSWHQLYSIKSAIALGVDAVIATLFIGNNLESRSMRIVAKLADECLQYNLPLAVQAVPVQGPYIRNELDYEIIALASRIASELGADFVNSFCPDKLTKFNYVSQTSPVPVLVSGGPLLNSEAKFLEKISSLLSCGSSGFFIGRNIWQRKSPASMLRKIQECVHSNTSAL